MNDDVCRRGCSPETHRKSLILHSGFSRIDAIMCDRPPGLSAAHMRGAGTADQVSSPYERRRQSARVLRIEYALAFNLFLPGR
jgi:hypothetical protein